MGELRIALVTPWFGRGLIGGAERLAWDLSFALARNGARVDVLTTCARSFHDDWSANYHRAGAATVDGVTVRRFRVDPRDRVAFARANAALLAVRPAMIAVDAPPLAEESTRPFVAENISSRALSAFLRERGNAYDAVLFVPYLYGPTLHGLPIVADRAWLIPCLHDEPYAYLDAVRDLARSARGILFNSQGEAEVASAIFGPWIHAKSAVIGHAVEPVSPPRSALSINGFVPQRSRYVLYLGRQDRTKNVDALVESFAAYRRRHATSLQLVLAGPRTGARRGGDGVLDLGPVNEDAKAALLTYARALAQPSLNESFSRTIYEAWFAQRPVLVHGGCRATACAVEDCGGGWIASTPAEWYDAFAVVDESADDDIDAIGRNGWAAALDNGTWDAVAMRVIDAIAPAAPAVPAVTQLVPLGDARAAAAASAYDAALRAAGVDAAVTISGGAPPRFGDALIAHAVAGVPTPDADLVVVHDGDAQAVGGGPVLAASLAVLEVLGVRGTPSRLVPPPVDPARWQQVEVSGNRWRDGRTNILSLAPLGRDDVDALLELVVASLEGGGDPRVLIFASSLRDGSAAYLSAGCRDLDLDADAVVTVDASVAATYEAYRAADVGIVFGRPVSDVACLVEPLWFDIPLLAADDPFVREVVEPSGIVAETRDPARLATLVRLLANDAALRAATRAEGRRVRARYAASTVTRTLMEALGDGRGASRLTERT